MANLLDNILLRISSRHSILVQKNKRTNHISNHPGPLLSFPSQALHTISSIISKTLHCHSALKVETHLQFHGFPKLPHTKIRNMAQPNILNPAATELQQSLMAEIQSANTIQQ